MTIREFLLNNKIFYVDDIRIDSLDSDPDRLYLFQGPWYMEAALDYLDRKIITFYYNFDFHYTVFYIE